ncbi:acidic endochitinase WIN6.2B-like [Etheostoma cragini]|uniref:acidic endochitinase WIN6.2B-like n=1 Tax=Etheostoma cragini TaxID=417921 RepID=UPI00155E1A97|nr:acidic endochitinase WIN6.2B-like [Etheostoma cragini]
MTDSGGGGGGGGGEGEGGGGGGGGTGSPNLPTSLLPPPPPQRQTPLLAYRIRVGPPPSSLSLPHISPLCPAHPGGLFSSPVRANPRLGVSRASRFLVLRKKELGVGVGQRRQHTGGQSSPESRRSAETRQPTRKTPTYDLAKVKTSWVSI